MSFWALFGPVVIKMICMSTWGEPQLYAAFYATQAFLELGTEETAITMVNYYTAVTPHVRNVPVFIQYSNHKELKTDNALNQVRGPV